jgi:hypothetical protein
VPLELVTVPVAFVVQFHWLFRWPVLLQEPLSVTPPPVTGQETFDFASMVQTIAIGTAQFWEVQVPELQSTFRLGAKAALTPFEKFTLPASVSAPPLQEPVWVAVPDSA